MNLLAPNQTDINLNNIVYKNSSFSALIAFLVMASVLGIVIVLWAYDRVPMDMLIFSGFFMLIISIVYFRKFLKTLKPENWVVSLADDYMLIKFRSYMNTHLPKNDIQIVQIEYNEIISFFIGKKTRVTPSASGGTRHEAIKYLDIYLNSDTNSLKNQLNHERNLKQSKNLQFYLFVMGKNKVRIHWSDVYTSISPNLKHIARSLIDKDLYQTHDERFVKKELEKISDEDKNILELYDNGHQIEAVSLARRMYGIGLTEAKSYVHKM